MPFKLWARRRVERRKSSPEDRLAWERDKHRKEFREWERQRREQQEREDIERRLAYLKADAEIWARKEL